MKKKLIVPWRIGPGIEKILRIMKLTIGLLIFFGLSVSATGLSQNQKLNISMKDANLLEIFQEIEKKTDFGFLFKDEHIDLSKTYSIDAQNEAVHIILEQLLNASEYNYTIIENNVVISKTNGNNDKSNSIMPLVQQLTVQGKVTDANGEALPGVNVYEKSNPSHGVITGIDGAYSIKVDNQDNVLVFSYIGFIAQEIVVGGRSSINITLLEETKGLDEVVVIGYGTVRKRDLTGSVSTVTEKDFNLGGSVTTPEALIQGRAAGVQVSTVSAAPGSEPVIRIRGNNSLLGSNSPLYVVDGLQMESLDNMLNVEDIKSMEILKDASSTAIYGTRGANGVVIITTKRGIQGKTSIDYSYEYTIDEVANKDAYDFTNATEYALQKNFLNTVDNDPPVYGEEALSIINDKGEGTVWLDEIFQTGGVQKHNLSISAGNESTTAFMSVHYMDQEGVVPNTNFEKITTRLNLDQKLINDRLKVSVSTLISNTKQDALGFSGSNSQSNIMRNVFKGNPIVPTSWDNWTDEERQTVFAMSQPINPMDMINYDENEKTNRGIVSNLSATLDIIDGLSFTTKYGVKIYNLKTRRFIPQVEGMVATEIPMGSASIYQEDFTGQSFENILRYNKELGEHRIGAVAIYSQNPRKWESVEANAQDFVSDNLMWNNLGAGATPLTPQSGIRESNLVSYAGRLEYGFSDRYNITATFRRDGSSKFGEDNQWGTFPSMSAAWNVHNEGFFNTDFISNLKLRAGWGITGNDGFAIGAAQKKYDAGYAVTLDSDNIRKGLAAANKGNMNLKWETTYAKNLGIELGLLKNRISLELDLYDKLTEDLLWQKPTPPSSGFSTQIDNIGTVQNKGYEILLSTENVSTAKFRWSTDFTFAQNTNTIKELDLPPGATHFDGPTVGHHIKTSALIVGESLGSFFGYKYRGILEGPDNSDELQPGARQGDVLYHDVNGDGVVSADDKTVIGQGVPKYTFGFNNRIVYGNFELSFFFWGVGGVDILNLNNIVGYEEATLTSSINQRWTPENTHGTQPMREWGRDYYTNDYNLESGNYITLRNLRLAYSIPTSKLGMSWMRHCTISFTGQNLFTLTDYSGFFPEVNSSNGGAFDARIAGVDSYAYPMQKSYSFGVQIGF